MTRELPADWAPNPDPFAVEPAPGVIADAVLWVVAIVCGLALGVSIDLLVATV